MNGAYTRTKRERGIEDSADLFTSDTLKGGPEKPHALVVLQHSPWQGGFPRHDVPLCFDSVG